MALEKEISNELIRCAWASTPLSVAYHDEEWGVPVFDDRRLFEFLVLEGAQAGLSWETILKKRQHYRAVFDQFDAEAIVKYDAQKIEQLLADPGIIRNRAKIQSAIQNAGTFLALQKEYGSFCQFIWQFVDYHPKNNHLTSLKDLPSKTPVSDEMSKALKQQGFTFVGSTICYSFMQATGMVNDHIANCFRYKPLAQMETRSTCLSN